MSNIKITKIAKSRIDSVNFDDLPFGKIFTDHMYVADYADGQWSKGEIRPLENLSIHPGNCTLHYGQSIFEGMKASVHLDGTPMLFRPEMHAQRINASADRLCMATFPEDQFLEALHTLVDLEKAWIPKEKGSALYIRPFMFGMDDYLGVHSSAKYKFIIMCLPSGPYYAKPVSLKVEDRFVRAVAGGTGEAKAAGNYAASLFPSKIAKQEGYDQVMWMDAHEFKYVQEVGTMNIFFKIGDTVITPSLDGAILRGITRNSIITYLKSEGVNVEERKISIDEIISAHESGELKEVFGSGTAAICASVSKIGYKGKDLLLDVDHYTLAPKIKAFINGLRDGSIKDTFGWTVPVKSLEMVT